ncbi:MAG: hypothetical protein AB1650_07380 [Candidatus Omnitrophota bacterium]
MQIISRFKSFLTSSLFLPFILSFAVWIFAFRGFVFGSLAFVEDAVSYLNQTKFLTDSMLQGTLLLWSSEAFGMPNDFFLLRLGAFNPLFVIITLLRSAGIPFFVVYVWSMAGYYFLGCCGFYFLSKRITGHRLAALMGFLLLYFSALGTRIFDSYIILVFVPLMWFFFFIVDFFTAPSRKSFIGSVFTMMLLLSTYIPFYFLFILLVFLVFMAVVFPKKFLNKTSQLVSFIASNKILCFCGLIALLVALIPGVFFFQSSHRGEFVMPLRHDLLSSNDAALEVHPRVTSTWASIEDIAFSNYFTDLRQMKFAIIYVPFLTWILLSLGLLTKMTKRFLFYFLFAGFFLALGIPQDLPLYQFLHERIFFFKYFRNLHFFLWWVILPVMFLLIAEQTGQILGMLKHRRRFDLIVLLALHIMWLYVIFKQPDYILSTVISILLSWIFFTLIWLGADQKKVLWLGLGAMVVFSAQPLEVFFHLSSNSKSKEQPYYFERIKEKSSYLNDALDASGAVSFYIAMNQVVTLQNNLPPEIFYRYSLPEFVVYDQFKMLKEPADWNEISDSFKGERNIVFVEDWDEKFLLAGKQKRRIPIEGPGQGVNVISDRPNQLKVETFFDQPKLLVFNDTFSPHWKADIDGVSTRVYKANLAFKGVYVPDGKHTVTLRFEKHLWINRGVWLVFMSVFAALLFFSLTDKRFCGECDESLFPKNC